MTQYKLSRTSKRRLKTCTEDIQRVVNEAIIDSPIDFGVAEGHRRTGRQKKMFKEGKSQLDGIYKKSRHQSFPSEAFDLYAYKDGEASWTKKDLTLLAGHILGTANRLGVELKWGGDWVSFVDMPHFEE